MKKHIISIGILAFGILQFIAATAQEPDWLWAKRAGGTSWEESFNIVTDKHGNSYVSGHFFSHTITFGATTLTNSDNTGTYADIFVVKYDPMGNVIWAKKAGNSSEEGGGYLAIDTSGNCYLTANYWGPSITFGTITLISNGGLDIFVVKYNSSGNVVWAKNMGGTLVNESKSISVDANGNSYITGSFTSRSFICDGITVNNSDSINYTSDIFVAKLDSLGNGLWAEGFGGADEDDEGRAIVLGQANDFYMTGIFSSDTIDFSGITLINSNGINSTDDIFIAKFDTSCNVIWAKKAGGSNDDWSADITVDANGNSYITGSYKSPLILFDTIDLINVENTGNYLDIFIAKYNNSGDIIWAKSSGGYANDASYCISIDSLGNVYIAGSYYSKSIAFDGIVLINADTTTVYQDGYFAKLDSQGNAIWAKKVSGPDAEIGSGIAAGSAGKVYVMGNYQSPSLLLGGFTLINSSPGSNDFFIARLGYNAGVEELLDNRKSILIYPNPADGLVNISYFLPEDDDIEIVVYNAWGKQELDVLYKYQHSGYHNTSFNTGTLKSGIYFCKIKSSVYEYIQKLIVL